jgi:CRISPR/Cas system CMR subunit Cmr4 (Cas7 group RAMP superfamily)
MAVTLHPGDQLVRLEVVSPAHLGAAEGGAALERPTQKDAVAELPYLPDSALKGVLASGFGNPSDDEPNPDREALFGGPDRPGRPGRPRRPGRAGSLVAGNGELLCFPLPARDGLPVRVFPALGVARFLRHVPAGGEHAAELDLLRWVEHEERAFVAPRMPPIDPAAEIEALTGASVDRNGPALTAQLRRLAGPRLPAAARLLVAPSSAAGRLWRLAAERRTMTALDAARRVVIGGTLRTVELIPAGTVFLSLISWLGAADRGDALPDHLQAGAWEGLGLGWLELSAMEGAAVAGAGLIASPPPAESPASTTVVVPPSPGWRPAALDEARILTAAHAAVRHLRESTEPPAFRRAVRSIIYNFGPRAQFGGLAAALGFELAKARPAAIEPRTEARAHRWVLRALVTADADIEAPAGACAPLLEWLAGHPFTSDSLEAVRDRIFRRWHWLRRFAELGLEDEDDGDKDGDGDGDGNGGEARA